MSGSGAADQTTDGDDRISQVEEGVDGDLAAFVSADEPVEGVVPGAGPLDRPTLGGFEGRLLALVGELAGQFTFG
jgi:hypothetical protein